MGKCIFITGTDTDIGKTVISGCLASAIARAGKKVAYYKPVQCGNLLKGKTVSPDLVLVKELSGISDEVLFNDFSFSLAASPHLAAEYDKSKVDIKTIKRRVKSLADSYDIVIIEGAGGLIVPLTRSYTVLNLVQDLRVPVIVVARAGLGTINHTSMTLNILKNSKISVIGVILNFYKGGIIEDDNKKIIQSLNNVPVTGVVPFSKRIEKLANNFEKYFDINRVLEI